MTQGQNIISKNHLGQSIKRTYLGHNIILKSDLGQNIILKNDPGSKYHIEKWPRVKMLYRRVTQGQNIIL